MFREYGNFKQIKMYPVILLFLSISMAKMFSIPFLCIS